MSGPPFDVSWPLGGHPVESLEVVEPDDELGLEMRCHQEFNFSFVLFTSQPDPQSCFANDFELSPIRVGEVGSLPN